MFKTLIVMGLAGMLLAACDSRDNAKSNAPTPPSAPINEPASPPAPAMSPGGAENAGQNKGEQQLPKPGTVNDHSSPAAEPTSKESQAPEK